MELSLEQKEVVEKFKNNENIFITGPGGTGKSLLIKHLVNIGLAREKKVQVTALTGCAALLLGCYAKTLHGWAGIGLAKGDTNKIIDRVVKSKQRRKNWNQVDILIIDEVSMLSQKVFEILDTIGKRIKRNKEPFGGIQIVLSGDFFQLPPIPDEDETTASFCFESEVWKEMFDNKNIVELKTVFRQNDPAFSKILNGIRVGKLSRKYLDILSSRLNLSTPEEFTPTKLLPRRKEVDIINRYELNKLEGDIYSYEYEEVKDIFPCKDQDDSIKIIGPQYSQQEIDYELKFIKDNIMVESNLQLKLNSQVMCIANIDVGNSGSYGVANGSQGKIIRFEMGLPVVKFVNGTIRIIGKKLYESENISGVGIKQIPLVLAWAVTIHKSQGSSLDYVEIDIGSGIFEAGQTYVALSRVKSLDGLFISAFDPSKIKINSKVKKYYNENIN